MRKKIRAAAAGFCFLCTAGLVSASGFTPSQLVVFGDSLSDDGNAFIGSGGTAPGANYAAATYNGQTVQFFTDGPNTSPATSGPFGVWTGQLAGKLGIPDPGPSLLGGTDYAVGGAQTGTTEIYDVGNQVVSYLSTTKNTASPTALYTFWAGANDIEAGNNPITAANNITSYIQELAALGAKNFVWVNLPPLGDTPDGSASGASALLNAESQAFNADWATSVALLDASGLNVIGVNAYGLLTSIESNNAAGCTVGPANPLCFSNITTPAQGLSGVDPNDYLFWDGQHPTTAGQALIADLTLQSGDLTPVPEPASAALIGAAMMLAVAGRSALKKRRAAA